MLLFSWWLQNNLKNGIYPSSIEFLLTMLAIIFTFHYGLKKDPSFGFIDSIQKTILRLVILISLALFQLVLILFFPTNSVFCLTPLDFLLSKSLLFLSGVWSFGGSKPCWCDICSNCCSSTKVGCTNRAAVKEFLFKHVFGCLLLRCWLLKSHNSIPTKLLFHVCLYLPSMIPSGVICAPFARCAKRTKILNASSNWPKSLKRAFHPACNDIWFWNLGGLPTMYVHPQFKSQGSIDCINIII